MYTWMEIMYVYMERTYMHGWNMIGLTIQTHELMKIIDDFAIIISVGQMKSYDPTMFMMLRKWSHKLKSGQM